MGKKWGVMIGKRPAFIWSIEKEKGKEAEGIERLNSEGRREGGRDGGMEGRRKGEG